MSLADQQKLLAQLFTDEQFRRSFFKEPAAEGRRCGLSDTEAEALARIDCAAVERYAASLRSKRVLDARKTLPLTFRALGAEFDRLLISSIAIAPSPRRHVADAAALAHGLAQSAARGETPAWVADLARYELAFVEASSDRRRLVLRWFDFSVGAIATALTLGETIERPERRSTIGLWLRLSKNRGLVHRLI